MKRTNSQPSHSDLINILNVQEEVSKESLLEVVKYLAKNVQPQKEYLTRNEVAEYLGVTFQCLNLWVKRGLLNRYYLGNKPYYNLKEVVNTIGASRNAPTVIEIKV